MREPLPTSTPGHAALQDLSGTTVGRFHVRMRLGAGGMGEVYRADDMKLKRPVALKRVVPSLSSDPGYRQRFLKEAERASALTHQHIAAVYDVLEQNGEMFLVMEYVEGQTLRERMKAPLGERQFYEIAIQCSAALAVAHERGIVHHDIKPENIMLTASGEVKILDFGVARRLPHAQSGETTATSDSLTSGFSGTPAYMAPEVLLERPADGRADLFSLGVVLYEALTGKHPFRADSFMATCDRILREAAPPVTEYKPGISPDVERILLRLMAKDPADRYGTAAELLAELRLLHSGSGIRFPVATPVALPRARRKVAAITVLVIVAVVAVAATLPGLRERARTWLGIVRVPTAKHIAVIPFSAVGEDDRTQAMCDGLVETLTAKLSQFTERNSLQVVPASEARARGVKSAEQARTEFGVNLVVEGSYHRAGDMVRVNYRLVDAQTRRVVNSATITASAADPFGMEDQVVSDLLAMLNVTPRPEEQKRLTARGTQVARAYDFYLQGRGYLQNYDKPENVQNAISVFERALGLDPNYALAHAGLGDAYWLKYELTNDKKWVPSAQQACERALALDPNLAAGRICLGRLYSGTGQYEKATIEFDRALKLEPTSDDAYRELAEAQEHLQQFAEAEQTYRRAIQLRPHYWAGYSMLGVFYYHRARYREAGEMFAQVAALAPDSFRAYSNLGAIYVLQGRYAEAIQTLERSVAIRPTGNAYSNLATAYFHLKRFEDAARTYEHALQLEPNDYVQWWNLGDAYYWAPGRRPEAARAHRKAIELGTEKLRVNPRDSEALGVLAICHAMLGERNEALGMLARALASAPNDPDDNFRAAVVHSQLGDANEALRYLEKAFAAGYSASKVRDDPVFDKLREDPRFHALLNRK